MSGGSQRAHPYDAFAPAYNSHYGNFYLADARGGFERLLLPLLAPGGRILDLCCGTGQLAAWLASHGFAVSGLDASQAMLDYARRNAPEVEFILGDARDFVAQEPVDAVLSTFDSINHLPSIDDLERVFTNVKRSLRPNGIFFFDVNDEGGFENADGETYLADDGERISVIKSSYDAEAGQGVSQGIVFERDGDRWHRLDFEISEYWYAEPVLAEALERCGFNLIEIWQGDEDLGMPRAEGRLFFLARPR